MGRVTKTGPMAMSGLNRVNVNEVLDAPGDMVHYSFRK